MAYSKIRSAPAASAVCAVAALVFSYNVPAQSVPAGQTAASRVTSHVKNTGAQSVLKATPTPPSAKTCPTGYQGTPPNCIKKPQWDIKQNKPS